MSSAIGLFYGSSTCYTEMAGEKICAQINSQFSDSVSLHNIADQPLSLMADYDLLILGIPTWDYGELQEDWESHWDELDKIDFSGKQVALYGLGDQISRMVSGCTGLSLGQGEKPRCNYGRRLAQQRL
jgi:flavodoxin II